MLPRWLRRNRLHAASSPAVGETKRLELRPLSPWSSRCRPAEPTGCRSQPAPQRKPRLPQRLCHQSDMGKTITDLCIVVRVAAVLHSHSSHLGWTTAVALRFRAVNRTRLGLLIVFSQQVLQDRFRHSVTRGTPYPARQASGSTSGHRLSNSRVSTLYFGYELSESRKKLTTIQVHYLMEAFGNW